MINFSSSLSETVAAYRQTGGARPSAETLVNALLAAEKAAKQEKLTYPWSSLLGKWELCFATGTKKAQKRGGIVLGKGFYVPKFVNIQISFSASSPEDANKGEIANQVQFGPMLLQLTGPAHYLVDTPQPKGMRILASSVLPRNLNIKYSNLPVWIRPQAYTDCPTAFETISGIFALLPHLYKI